MLGYYFLILRVMPEKIEEKWGKFSFGKWSNHFDSQPANQIFSIVKRENVMKFLPQFYQFQTLTTMCIKFRLFMCISINIKFQPLKFLTLRNEKFKWVYVISGISIVSVIVCSSFGFTISGRFSFVVFKTDFCSNISGHFVQLRIEISVE